MNDPRPADGSEPLDRRLRQLAAEQADAAPAPHPWDDVERRVVPRRSSRRSWSLAAAAALVLIVGAAVVIGGREADAPSTIAPAETAPTDTAPVPTEPPGAPDVTEPPPTTEPDVEAPDGGTGVEIPAQLLLDGQPSGDTWTVNVANTTEELDALLAELEVDLDMEPIDFTTSVVIHFGPAASSSCPFGPLLTVRHDPDTGYLYPDLQVEGGPDCTTDANPHAVVVAIDRADLPDEAFTIWVENSEPPAGVAGAEIRVEAGELTEPPVAPDPAEAVTVPVSYSDAPPLYTPVPFATVERPSSVDGDVQFAVGDGIIVLIGGDANVSVLDTATGATTQRQLAVAVSQPVFGPDNLLYGLSFTPPTGESQVPDAAIVAQPIVDDPIEIVDSVDVPAITYLELPLGTLVAGPDGIYDVDRSRGKVMDYVGSGTVDLPTPALIDREPTDGTVVRSGDGSAEWILLVEQHPNAATPFVGERPAAPGPNGATRVVRYIGPRLETEPVDFGTPTHPVIADLQPGTGRWWSLPDDWSVAESSARGTLLVRDVGQRFELAWFEPESTD